MAHPSKLSLLFFLEVVNETTNFFSFSLELHATTILQTLFVRLLKRSQKERREFNEIHNLLRHPPPTAFSFSSSQSENFRIFLSFRFYVKSTLKENLEVLKTANLCILGTSEFRFFAILEIYFT